MPTRYVHGRIWCDAVFAVPTRRVRQCDGRALVHALPASGDDVDSRIEAAGKRAREGDTRAIPLAVRVGHAAYIGRVGVRPSCREKGGEDGREDEAEYALSEKNYERAHAALQVQTRVRGFLGRRYVIVGSIKAAKLKCAGYDYSLTRVCYEGGRKRRLTLCQRRRGSGC